MNTLFKALIILLLPLNGLNGQGILLKGGLNNSTFNYVHDEVSSPTKVRQGFQLGAYKDLSFGNTFYFQFGLLAQRKGMKDKFFIGPGSQTSKTIIDIYSIGTPVSIGKNNKLWGGNLFFQLGPVLNLNFLAIEYTEAVARDFRQENARKIGIGSSDQRDLRRFEISGMAALGYKWNAFQAAIQFEHGISNITPSTYYSSIRTRVLSFVFGYTFKKKQKDQ
ncbi:MAG: hypothetical protein R2879_13005 [Saprospiraceae bacterium]